MKSDFFKPRARLLLQLGDQLIKNENIALLELVKNSYDADAKLVRVELSKLDSPKEGRIVIQDDGRGMHRGIITSIWLQPGSNYKKRLQRISRENQSKYNRLPLGEKGIGRFSAHKLGKRLELITRRSGRKEVVVNINWDAFAKTLYLEDVKVDIKERSPKIFTGKQTGTRIQITDLQNHWTQEMIRDAYRSLMSLCSPFSTPDSFNVKFKIDNKDVLKGLLEFNDIKDKALYKFRCECKGSEIVDFEYVFKPYEEMRKLKGRVVDNKSTFFAKEKRMVRPDKSEINLSQYNIGKLTIDGLVFDREPKILEIAIKDRGTITSYLNNNGGVRVYRDGIRVLDYGDQENDWLGLGMRRINTPGKMISNNQILAAVHLDRENSSGLQEKTNREGFIENPSYNVFREAVLYVLSKIETLRREDKDKVRTLYGLAKRSEPVLSSISELNNIIEKGVSEPDLKAECLGVLKRIEADYTTISTTLMQSASAGLSLSIVLHEVDKIIAELKLSVKKDKPSKKTLDLVIRLGELVDGYSQIVRRSGRKNESIVELVEQALFNIEYRLEKHGVKVDRAYRKYSKTIKIKCAANLVLGTIMNIIDNSLWWFDYGKISDPRLLVSILDHPSGYKSILIADNGPGFSIPVSEIIKPFVTTKPGGMGIGLHLADEIMKAHDGRLSFPNTKDLKISPAYSAGATIMLSFKVI